MSKRLTPLRAIRLKCLDCCAGQRKEVRLCPVHDCPLWPFRMGRNHSNSVETQVEAISAKKPRKSGGVFGKSEVSEERGEALNLAL